MNPPVPPGSPLVLLEDVALTLASAAGPVDILRGVSLGIEPGETVARAVVGGPVLLLDDEPTGNLDLATGRIVIDCLFEEHARRGSGLLLITHEAGLAERCDRQLHLEDGRIVGETRSETQPLPLRPGGRRGLG